MTESIFDVVTEDIKGPHVAKQMPESPMEKHKGEERKDLLGNCKISADLGNGIPGRDQAVDIDKFLLPDRLDKLIEENDNIDTDDDVVHKRVTFGLNGVTQGNHFLRKLQLSGALESLQIQSRCRVIISAGSPMSTQIPIFRRSKLI
jgi:hypothetical protein